MSNTLTIELPFDLDPEEALLLLTIKLFEEGKVSLGYAAKMAGYSRRFFMELLADKGIPVYNYSAEDFERELETVQALSQQMGKQSGLEDL